MISRIVEPLENLVQGNQAVDEAAVKTALKDDIKFISDPARLASELEFLRSGKLSQVEAKPKIEKCLRKYFSLINAERVQQEKDQIAGTMSVKGHIAEQGPADKPNISKGLNHNPAMKELQKYLDLKSDFDLKKDKLDKQIQEKGVLISEQFADVADAKRKTINDNLSSKIQKYISVSDVQITAPKNVEEAKRLKSQILDRARFLGARKAEIDYKFDAKISAADQQSVRTPEEREFLIKQAKLNPVEVVKLERETALFPKWPLP